MNKKNQELWDQLRTAYRPQAPDLDTAAIMAAIRQEATAHPLRRTDPSPVAAIPTWVCAMAASLAILAAAGVIGRSVSVADTHISLAWLHSIQPDQFEQSILSFTGSSL
jgi:hypothetical protein